MAVAVAPEKKNTLIIDSNVIPIYPVRYAYANFFGEDIASASTPPNLDSFLGASVISKNNGYVIRLLREGWVYIKEEEVKNGRFQIFKYTKIKKGDAVIERYKKFQFKNRVDAKKGLVEDPKEYPYAFVRNGTKKISIVYSEHEWCSEVIDRINGSQKERESCMQQVDLSKETDNHSLEATELHLAQLVEDYKLRKDRSLMIKSGKSSLKDVSLDVFTTETSYELNPKEIADELQRKAPLRKKARIVALFDPVGRQKEIVEAHAKLILWEQEFASTNIYPFTIGQMASDLMESSNKDTRNEAKGSINTNEFNHHWKGMKKEFDVFHKRQKQFSKIYLHFMLGDGKVGSLDTYFKFFFCASTKDYNAEAQKLCKVSTDLFAGMMAAEPARKAMYKVASDDSENNAFKALSDALLKVLTTPHVKITLWNQTTKNYIDRLMLNLSGLLASFASAARYIAIAPQKVPTVAKKLINKLTIKAIKFYANKLVPALLHVMGLKISESKVLIRDDIFQKLLNDYLSDIHKGKISPEKGNTRLHDEVRKRVARGKPIYDWATSKGKTSGVFEIDEVELTRKWDNKLKFLKWDAGNVKKYLSLAGGPSLAGVSAYLNIKTLLDITNQTNYNKRHTVYNSVQVAGAISSLVTDAALLYQVGTAATGKAASNIAVAKALVPKISSHASKVGDFLKSTAATKLILVANVTGFISSTWDYVMALWRGDYGEAVGHGFMALGSAILAAEAITSLSGSAAAAGALGGPAVIVALALILIGFFLVYLFTKSPLERLLENCFWGKGSKYAFWTDVKIRPSIEERLERSRKFHVSKEVQNFYHMEFQEFMNLFYMPSLELDYTSKGGNKVYTYIFKLPGFIPGKSNIEGGLSVNRVDFFKDLREAIKKRYPDGNFPEKDGLTTIKVDVALPGKAILYWQYNVKPDVVVPIRFLNKDGTINLKARPGMIDDKPY